MKTILCLRCFAASFTQFKYQVLGNDLGHVMTKGSHRKHTLLCSVTSKVFELGQCYKFCKIGRVLCKIDSFKTKNYLN